MRLLALTTLVVAGTLTPTPASARERPNIVFLFSDDLTTQAISAYRYGMELPPTPNLDRLAAEGMLFENSFCGNSICTPSRGTVMTGLHSHENGIVHLGGALDPDGPSWPKALQKSGYTTAVFGKWHMKTKPSGFDAWEVFSGQGHYYNPELFSSKGGSRRIEGHSTDVVTDLALDWLRNRDASKPFAVMIQHKAPHRNWKPSLADLELYRDITLPEPPTLFDDYEGRVAAASHRMGIDGHMQMAYDLMVFRTEDDLKHVGRLTPKQRRAYLAAFQAENDAFIADPPTGTALVRWKYQRYMKNYLRCVAGVDRNVGRVLDWLDEAGLSDDTIVVYSADQGFYLGEHGWYDKRWAYEESMRMPLIVRWPGTVAAGSRCRAMVQNIDYAPTFLAAAGVDLDWKVHGVSLMPLLTNGGTTPRGWRDTLYYRYIDGGHGVAKHSAIRTDDSKLLYFDAPRNEAEEASRWELFDLAADPQEMRNLATDPAHASRLEAMKDRFWKTRELYDDTDEEVWTGRGRRFAPESYIRRPRWADRGQRGSARRFDPVARDVHGWTVHVDPALLEGEHRELGDRALSMLANHLERIALLVDERRLEEMRTLEIWIEHHHPTLGNMQYHPSGGWLRTHGHDERLTKKVHIPRAGNLLSRDQLLKHPAVVLHELAHAYHDQILGFADERIVSAYEHAKAAGDYEDVLAHTGRTVRHYAMNDHKEYFAEATEAYFYRNDFYPFVRAELKVFDPRLHELLVEIWGR